MYQLSLNGGWRLFGSPEQNGKLEEFKANAVEVGATVPGNVELDFMRAGRLPQDLLTGDKILMLQNYENWNFLYEREFTAEPGKPCELIFEGVDCFASYYLNGEKIGESENMFIEHKFNVTGKLKQTNVLQVALRSPVVEAMKKEYYPIPLGGWGQEQNFDQLYVRKAPHSYGWDIMPRAVSAGLWRGVSLREIPRHEITDCYITTVQADEKQALLLVNYRVQTQPDLLNQLEILVEGVCGGSRFEKREKMFFSAGRLMVAVENPRLWMPAGYGEPNLYQVKVTVFHRDVPIAEISQTLGIRTLELERTDTTGKDRPGEFIFRINRTPVLCKGTNWVPLDLFHSRDAEKYEKALALARDLKCNIIRCWGGNVYEDTRFFDLCDQYGIMVWQDFAMACANYPQDDEFAETMRTEAEKVVKKLRRHPSLIIWCGDNECDYLNGTPENNRITRQVLKKTVEVYDPYRPYICSSPYIADQSKEPSEQHLWGNRAYFKSKFYEEHTAHFVSEIGYHGCPQVSSIQKFITEENLWPWEDNKEWKAHCTDAGKGCFTYRCKLMADQIKQLFGKTPETLEEFAFASQASQAEAKKHFIEMIRLKKWRTTGVIWWNLLDGWPQFSDAVVDYYWEKKLAYYYIKRVQEPLCLMVRELNDWSAELVMGNDSCSDFEGTYRVLDGDTKEIMAQGKFNSRDKENMVLE